MKKRIQHGCTVYESMTECMDALDLSYSVLTGLLDQAEQGKQAMLMGQPIRPLSGALHHVERPEALVDAARIIRRRGRPLLTGGYCTHRLGTYHGGRV
jgi:hypothetical protein